jgi:putative ABC transport system permease protein
MQSIAQRLAEESPQTNRGWQVRVVPARKFLTGELTVRYTVFVMYAVGFVLLIACANVANLQFARSAGRQKEIAVRTAMGASRWRIVRQLLMESVLVALAGAALSILLGQWAVDLILANMPAEIAKYVAGWEQIRMDGRVFLFTLGIATLAGIISGLAPAVISSKPDLNETLKETSRGASAGSARSRLRNMLLVGEIALALILLVGAGLMIKGVHALMEVNRNFAPESLLTMRLTLPQWKYKEAQQTVHVYEEAVSALETIPGVTSTTLATNLPYGNGGASYSFIMEGRPAPAPGELRRAQIQNISPNYFRAMHIRLREGHAFSEADSANTKRVAVIGESFARQYFRGEDPLGKRIKFEESEPWKTIVGVADDVHYEWIDRKPAPVVYQPYRQSWWPSAYLAVRTNGDPLQLVPAVRSRIAAIDPELPVFEIKTLDRVISQSVLGLSYVAVIMTVVGAIALVLACVGVYGVMAYTVSERTREIGIRMALGAERVDVLRMVMGRGMVVTAAGLVIGFAIAFMLAHILSSLIFGVSATDWQIFFGISLALAAAALTASYVPARRATRVDPVIALRYE